MSWSAGLGRTRGDWLDVWFFGMQLTFQERPDQLSGLDQQGVRHFGVALDRPSFERLMERLADRPIRWLSGRSTDPSGLLSGKTSVKVADPSGNVIELQYYDDADHLGSSSSAQASTSGPAP